MLLYPNKPPEVSDDIESFIHVLEFCALRFHYHNFTKENSWGERAKTTPNTLLAEWVADFFFYDRDRETAKQTYGGKGKFIAYSKSTSNWWLMQRLHNGQRVRSTEPFQHLLEKLHQLCYQHYACIDHEKLAPYSDFETQESQQLQVHQQISFAAALAAEGSTVRRSKPSQKAARIESKLATTIYPDWGIPFILPEHRPASDPLADHAALFEAFEEALYDEAEGWTEDRLPEDVDQFEYLPGIGFIPDKMNTHSFTSGAVSSTASEENPKTRSDHGVVDSSESRKRRRKDQERVGGREGGTSESDAEDSTDSENDSDFPNPHVTPTKSRKSSEASSSAVPTTPKASAEKSPMSMPTKLQRK